MKVEYKRDKILIIPENDTDKVYLEYVLKVYKEGDCASIVMLYDKTVCQYPYIALVSLRNL